MSECNANAGKLRVDLQSFDCVQDILLAPSEPLIIRVPRETVIRFIYTAKLLCTIIMLGAFVCHSTLCFVAQEYSMSILRGLFRC